MSTFCAKIGEFSYFLWNSSKSPPFWINPTDPHPQKSVPPFGPKIPQNGKIPPFWPHWIISKIWTIHPEPLKTIDFGQKSIQHTSWSSFSHVVCRKNKQTNKFSQKLITATKQAQFLFHLNCHNNKNNSPNKWKQTWPIFDYFMLIL